MVSYSLWVLGRENIGTEGPLSRYSPTEKPGLLYTQTFGTQESQRFSSNLWKTILSILVVIR